MQDFASEPWRTVLAKYASQLDRALRADLASLSDTGVSVANDDRFELKIEPFTPDPEHEKRRTPDGTVNAAAPEVQLVLRDSAFFQRWQTKAVPLLIVAPFGCGKSVLLANFTCHLAERLKAWCVKPSHDMPWVPFPVRLRSWRRTETLDSYIRNFAQRDVNSTGEFSWLTSEQIQALKQAEVLLPLFDGLDELSSEKSIDGVAIPSQNKALADIWLLYPKHHVVSCRPGYGAEYSGYTLRGTIHTLREFNADEAEKFIGSRLGSDLQDLYRGGIKGDVSPHSDVTAMFRRPLFLSAWCSQPPAKRTSCWTRSGLLEIVFNQVLDHRIADHTNRQHDELRNEIRRQRHFLGAVLAVHADTGFAVEIQPEKLDSDIQHNPLFLKARDGDVWMKRALKMGLLQQGDWGSYVPKTPISEYLIGSYYAWLADKAPGESTDRQTQLTKSFQRRFWWSDHEEVWLYAFELMWMGSESQRTMAADLTEWVLALSQDCLNLANWTDQLPEGQEHQDRQTLPLEHTVLSALLPANPTDSRAIQLFGIASAQLQMRHQRLWRDLRMPRASLQPLNRLAKRLPRLVIDWLLGCLGDLEQTELWEGAAHSLGSVAQHLTSKDVSMLVDYFRSHSHRGAWGMIGFALANTPSSIDRHLLTSLLTALESGDFKPAWKDIASAIADKAKYLRDEDIERLRMCQAREIQEQDLKPKEYNGPIFGIVLAIRGASAKFRETNIGARLVWLEEDAAYFDPSEGDTESATGLPAIQSKGNGLKDVADAAARAGRLHFVRLIINYNRTLILFVRGVAPQAAPGQRIVYGVAERKDADLRLNPACAPATIRAVLGPEAVPSIEFSKSPEQKDSIVKGGELSSPSKQKPDPVTLVLIPRDRCVLINGEEVGKNISKNAVIVLQKLIERPLKVWKYSDLLGPPVKGFHSTEKKHQEHVRSVVQSLPDSVQNLIRTQRGNHGGRRLYPHVKGEIR
jgi:hypothetical protein